MRTTFEHIPEWFIIHYDDQFREWGRNLRKINESNLAEGLPHNTKRVLLREGIFADPSPDPGMGPVLLQVTLRMKVLRSGHTIVDGIPRKVAVEVGIKPHTEEDQAKIKRHCEKMVRLGIDPRKRLIEAPRAGIPFMPQRLWAPPTATELRGERDD